MAIFNGTADQIENNVNKVAEITEANTNETNYPSTAAVVKAISEIDIPEVDLSDKMDKFGEVTETGDEILIKLNSFKPNGIGKPLRIETADGHTELVLRDWEDYAYFRVGESIIKSITGNKGWNFDKTALKDIGEPYESTDATTKGYVDNLVGDIETALDSIIALQNSYIGGEAV